jgi:hypothetical protein
MRTGSFAAPCAAAWLGRACAGEEEHTEGLRRSGRLARFRACTSGPVAGSYSGTGPDPLYTLDDIIGGRFDGELSRWARKAGRSGIPVT